MPAPGSASETPVTAAASPAGSKHLSRMTRPLRASPQDGAVGADDTSQAVMPANFADGARRSGRGDDEGDAHVGDGGQ